LKRELKENLIKENPPVLPTSPPMTTSYAQKHMEFASQKTEDLSSTVAKNRTDLPLVFVDINLGKEYEVVVKLFTK
jgi:hypothetical protein